MWKLASKKLLIKTKIKRYIMAESMGKDLCPKKAYQNEVRIKDKMFCKETHMSSKVGSVFSYKKIVLSKVATTNL